MIYSSLCNFVGLSLNNAAVQRIDYLLLTMIKAPKSLSIVGITLVVGLLSPSNYQPVERSTVLNVLVFTAGLFLFNLSVDSHEQQSGESRVGSESSLLGVVLCAAGSLCDAFSGFFQMGERKKYNPSPFMFMKVISFHTAYCALIAGKPCSPVLLTGELGDAARLFGGSTEALLDQAKLTATNVLGLTFIFVGLSQLGPIKLAFITSSRKVFSMLVSIFVFNKNLSYLQVLGMMLVFFGMLSENLKGKEGHKQHKHPKEAPPQDGPAPANEKAKDE